jgi:hypothetical protein
MFNEMFMAPANATVTKNFSNPVLLNDLVNEYINSVMRHNRKIRNS